MLAGFGLSALLCPLLVYGWLGLPRLGLAGSAVANLLGQWLAAVFFGRALLAERVPLRLTVMRCGPRSCSGATSWCGHWLSRCAAFPLPRSLPASVPLR